MHSTPNHTQKIYYIMPITLDKLGAIRHNINKELLLIPKYYQKYWHNTKG